MDIDPSYGGLSVHGKWYTQSFDDAPNNLIGRLHLDKNSRNVAAHEFAHYVFRPTTYPEGFDFHFGDLNNNDYFRNNYSTEVSARGT